MATASVIEHALAGVRGAVAIERTGTGYFLHRTSERTRQQLADDAFEYDSGVPSGIRIAAVTDASFLELHFHATRTLLTGQPMSQGAFDIEIDGELQDPMLIKQYTRVLINPRDWSSSVTPADPTILRIDLSSEPRSREVIIWLPANARIHLLDVRVPEAAVFHALPDFSPLWVHHGSSISQCTEVDRPTDTWPARVARSSQMSLLNLGLAGQCHLDQGIARTIRDSGADAISIEVGINIVGGDTMHERTFVSALHGFIDTVREGAPTTPILVISPFYCGFLEHQTGPTVWSADGTWAAVNRPATLVQGTLSLVRTRALIEQHIRSRQRHGDEHLHLVDGLDLFGDRDADLLPDGLHPNTQGYARIADRFGALAFGSSGLLR